MEAKIKKEVLEIYKKIKDAGFEVYLVGGCVRDLIMDREVKDWDLTTNATPEQIQVIFHDSFYDNKFGTVGIPYEEKKIEDEGLERKNYIEITTFRTERGYKDLRRPDQVEWGKTLEEDLKRRDFTINAVAGDIIFTNNDYRLQLIDPFNGQDDLINKIIKAKGNPYERFQEDALRLMRAIRFAAQLGFKIEQKTHEAITANSRLISHISFERIRDELLKILESNNPYEGIKLLDETGILEIILPELTKGKSISQVRPDRHHKDDVFTHSLLSLKNSPTRDSIVNLAILLHDIGKSYVASKDEQGLITFYNHEVVGARLSKEIASRLRLSKKQREKLYTLVRWHMFSVSEYITDSAVRRFIRRVGVENVRDAIDLRIADRLGSGVKAESWRLRKYKDRIEKQLNPPFSINDLAVNGHDVMKELDVKPGPIIGKILNKLFEEVDEDLSRNNREYLMKRIKELGQEMV
ncbi:HD domain-containing protein [Candidatus Parcubacteria bacterium]|nr:MAG: HD domain-containing protein [Candidatus Parcubacteria bacterium]